jgi:hypothetical protein
MTLARSLLCFTIKFVCNNHGNQRSINLNTTISDPPSVAISSNSRQNSSVKKSYKSVPENYKVISEIKYHKIVADLEAILLDISTDGIGINTPDGKISESSLKNWAESLRDALQSLSKAQ